MTNIFIIFVAIISCLVFTVASHDHDHGACTHHDHDHNHVVSNWRERYLELLKSDYLQQANKTIATIKELQLAAFYDVANVARNTVLYPHPSLETKYIRADDTPDIPTLVLAFLTKTREICRDEEARKALYDDLVEQTHRVLREACSANKH